MCKILRPEWYFCYSVSWVKSGVLTKVGTSGFVYYTFVCGCVWACAQRTTVRVGSLSPCGSQESNTVRQPWPQASLPINPYHQPETSAVGPCHPGLQVFAYVNSRWGSVLSSGNWRRIWSNVPRPYQASLKCSEHVCESAVVHTANIPSLTGIITSPGQQLKEQFLLNPSCFLSTVISLSHTCKEPSVFE